MNEFSADFLIGIAESANIPRFCYETWPWQVFEGDGGWKVMVFYDADELDYIERFETTDGRKIDIWEWPASPEKDRITGWPDFED